jgi:hypothetical protein
VKTGFFKNSEDFFQKNRAIAQNSELPTSYLLEIIRNLSKALFLTFFLLILENYLFYLSIDLLMSYISSIYVLEVPNYLVLK